MKEKDLDYNNDHYREEPHATRRRFHVVEARKNNRKKEVPIYEVGDFISEDTYKKYRSKFCELNPFEKVGIDSVNGHLFGKGEVMKLISQPECHGVRIYYGVRENRGKLEPQLMLVGVYRDGADMIDHTLILDASLPCPDYCDPT